MKISRLQQWVKVDKVVTVLAGTQGPSLDNESDIIPVVNLNFRVLWAAFTARGENGLNAVQQHQVFLNLYDEFGAFVDFLLLGSANPFPNGGAGDAMSGVVLVTPSAVVHSLGNLKIGGVTLSCAARYDNPTAGDLDSVGALRGLIEVWKDAE